MSKILIIPITPFFFLIGLLFCAPVISFSQNDHLMENGAVFKFKRHWYKHNMVYGSLLQNDYTIQNIETVSGDTVSFPIDSARKYYLPEQITLCKNGRYHYASGKIKNFSMGVSRDHVNLDFVYGFRINRHFDIGIGTGMDHNAFSFYTVDDFHLVNIVGTPLYIQGKYNLYRKRRIIYLKAKVGMTNNSETARCCMFWLKATPLKRTTICSWATSGTFCNCISNLFRMYSEGLAAPFWDIGRAH